MTPATPRWPRLFKGSIAWHVAGGAALAAAPSTWPWVASALVANHALIAMAGLLPRARLMGPCLSRLPQTENARPTVAMTFDDGPDPEVTPLVLEILADRSVKATFFPIGRRAERHPSLIEEIVKGGHALGNHSWNHSPSFFFHTNSRLAEEIDRSQELLESLAGVRPVHFRAPAGIRGPLLQPMLERRGLKLTAWTRRGFDTVDTRPGRIVKRLVRRLGAGDILLLHDGSSARTHDGRATVSRALPILLDAIDQQGLEPVLLVDRETRGQH